MLRKTPQLGARVKNGRFVLLLFNRGASILSMSNALLIRKRLGMTQEELAEKLNCTQGNVSHYESRGQSIPPDVAKRLIKVADERGVPLSFDDIYSEGLVA